ncbi:hypothetical protein ACH40E_19205 [Streptomyces acidicola]|uniref:hypothetical protein n=1 Tax=Streptomyces acidicola TaxID=2596892 RepID=UPI0037B0A8E4
MGTQLLGHAEELVSDPKTGPSELRYLSARLTESLRDVLRVAESRGARLPVPDALSALDEGDDSRGPREDDNMAP